MLRTQLNVPSERAFVYDVLGVVFFTAVMAVSARISILIDPVPFTLQPLAALLSGLVLGARGGLMSQLLYVALIAAGLPLDSNARGTAALFGPTAGYIIGFIPAAFVAGWLAERGHDKLWLRFVAGIAGVIVIYVCGVIVLMNNRALPFDAAWVAGVAPFILPDFAKAIIAATLAEGGRAVLGRFQNSV